jgi:hypothetical protein
MNGWITTYSEVGKMSGVGEVAAVVTAIAALAGAGTAAYSAATAKGPPKPPPFKPPPLPPPVKKVMAPAAVPGIEDKQIGAGALDERRRILASMPTQTKNTYGGNITETAPIQKKRLLGGGIGQETTGA